MEKLVLLVSLYPNKKSSNCSNLPLSQVMEDFKSGKYATVVNEARKYLEEGNKEAYDNIKSELSAHTFSATFEGKRLLENITHYNNLMVMDYDKLDRRRLREIKRSITKDKHAHFVFESPSGLGLKVGFLHNGGQENHKLVFNQVNAYLKNIINEEADPSGKDINRLTFVSNDPELHYNPDSEVFMVDTTTIKHPTRRRLKDLIDEDIDVDSIHVLDTALEFLNKNNISITNAYSDWYSVARIISSLDLSDEVGLDYFIRFSQCDPDKFDEEKCIVQYEAATKDNDGSIKIGTLIYLLKQQGFEYQKPIKRNPGEFWIINKGKVEIDLAAFNRFLCDNGYRMMMVGGNGRKLVKITDSVLEEVTAFHVKNFVMNFVNALPENIADGITRDDLIREIMKKTTLFTNDRFDFLDKNVGSLHKDNSQTSYFYFTNGFVKVTKDSISLHPYSELDGHIWKNQIVNREFHFLDPMQDSVFNKFIHNVTGDNQDRFFSLISAIGYLLCRYKDSANAKVIIFVDEQISRDNEANGGTGKTLIAKAISKIRNMVTIDGKNFTWGRFSFQQVNLDTNVLLFDDIKSDFIFENLYSTTTTGIDVEKKNENRFNIPFEDAPKITINTNYVVRGTGGHTEERRKFTIEISDHYGPHLTPDKEFGHRFFEDWDKEEWNRFDNFMVNSSQTFLQNGLISYDHVNLEKREIIGKTKAEFIEFMESEEFVMDKNYRIDTLLNNFKEDYPDYSRLTQHTFNKWLRLYIEYRKWNTYEFQRTNGKDHFHKRDSGQYFSLV
jgi:hypothetical protein